MASSASAPASTSRRRDRTDPLQDAKDAINNTTLMNEGDRYQLFSTSLLTLSENDRVDLVSECIREGWCAGLTFLISGLSAASLESADRYFFTEIIEAPLLTEQQKVDMTTSFLYKGCNVNGSRKLVVDQKSATRDDLGKFIVFTRSVFSGELDRHVLCTVCAPSREADLANIVGIRLVQVVVQQNLPRVLDLIVSRLDTWSISLGLVEAIGSNNRSCYEVLIDKTDEYRTFTFLLLVLYNRVELLKILLSDASAELITQLQEKKFSDCGQDAPLPAKCPETMSIFEAAVHLNHPDCLALIIKHVFPKQNKLDVIPSLLHCAQTNQTECAIHILNRWNFSTASLLVPVLESSFQCRCDADFIVEVVEKMKKSEGNTRIISMDCSSNASRTDGLTPSLF